MGWKKLKLTKWINKAEELPGHLQVRYDILLESFQNSPFTFEEAAKLLFERKENHEQSN